MKVFFPTYRSNILGVRDVSKQTGLAGIGNQIVIPRAPSEPYPRAANNPTGRMLGGMGASIRTKLDEVVASLPSQQRMQPVWSPVIAQQLPISTVTQSPGAPLTQPAAAAPPVSAQNSPTPTVTIPIQQSNPAAVLITSGGGTAAPSTAATTPIVYGTDQYGNIINTANGQVVMSASDAEATGNTAASLQAGVTSSTDSATSATSLDVTDQVAAWLSGTTTIGGYAVPNPVLVGVVVLGFALLMGGGKKK